MQRELGALLDARKGDALALLHRDSRSKSSSASRTGGTIQPRTK
jgi:hypothetical protein